MKSIANRILLVGALSLMAACTQEKDPVTHFPENPTHHDSLLLTIDEEFYQNEDISSIEIDANELGMPEPVQMDETLHQITLAIEDDVAIGEKMVAVTVTYGNKETETFEEIIQIEEADPLAFSWDDARIYFALTDRFYNGDKTNDFLSDSYHLEAYHGGDFKGMIEKIPYLEDLGINTLWITPIVDNIEDNMLAGQNDKQYGYHGYWAKDFTTIDEHLGDVETFQTLLETAHDHGIKVMVDVVLNHPGYGTEATFEEMVRTDPIPNHQVLGELAGLPDFMTEDPDVRKQLIAWQTAWIEQTKTERGDTIDFFRVDTVKHVEDTTWKAFKNAVTTIQPDFKLIGEHYGASIDNTGGYLHDGEMDSLLDFDFKNMAGQFVNWDLMGVQEKLIQRNEQLTSDATMGQFLSSHDEDGFLYKQAGGDEGKQKVAASLLITAKGQPVIYYGEELGMTGPAAKNMLNGEYNENRYDFDWQAVGNDMHTHYQKLLHIRKDNSLLFSKGDRETIAGSNQDGFLFFSRTYADEQIIVGLNILDQPTETDVNVPFTPGTRVNDLYSGIAYTVTDAGMLSLTLPPKSQGGTVILKAE